jgi:hypothetical protein
MGCKYVTIIKLHLKLVSLDGHTSQLNIIGLLLTGVDDISGFFATA